MCLNNLCTGFMADLVMGGQTLSELSSHRGWPPCKDKKQTLVVMNVIESNCWDTVHEVTVSAGCSKSTAQCVLTADLGLSHISARWVPRLLTEEEKSARVGALRQFLDTGRSDPTFLDRINTTDETWVHYYEPEEKGCLWYGRIMRVHPNEGEGS